MSSIGNPNQEASAPVVATEPARQIGRSRPSLLTIFGAVALFGLGLFFASQFIGVLYGLVFIPDPPLPPNSDQANHSSEGYGFDEWLYHSSDDACQVARYFASNGGRCTYAPAVCDAGFLRDVTGTSDQIARCVGEQEFSIFAMRWTAEVLTSRSADIISQFRLNREVFWSGTLPPDRTDLPDLDELLLTPAP